MGRSGEEESDCGLDRLAEDWIALWQSELAALAADPEWVGAWQQAMAMGAAWMRAAATAMTPPAPATARPPHEHPRDETGTDAAPRSAAAAAASGAGSDASLGNDGGDDASLRARLAELERRLAALERRTGGGGADRAKPRRRRPPA